MRALLRSHFASAVVGGLAVALVFLALGITGRRTTQTVVEESPIAAQPASSDKESLTPHAIYQRDSAGVVFVRAQIVQQVQDPFDLFREQERTSSTGSGFLIDHRGNILTNHHVIEGADRSAGVSVQFKDDVTRRAVVVGEDPNDDLALLKVDPREMPSVAPLTLGDSTSVRVGDPTLAIGNPFGLDRTLTTGIVSALQREIRAPNGFSIDNVIQTDAPINPGNSGGPLIDATGRVIGISSQMEIGAGGGSVGIAFAVPINTAVALLPRLERGGRVQIAYLGLTGAPAHGAHRGVMVDSVQLGGPAAAAGLRKGDEIESMAGRTVTKMGDVQALVEAREPGQTVSVRVRRAGRSRVVTVALGRRLAQASQ